MECRTGKIYESCEAAPDSAKPYVKEMVVDPTTKQLRLGRVGRNEPCPCGSGRKFKACCKIKES